jgi:lipopolysaccharide cholinephosphotransferase
MTVDELRNLQMLQLEMALAARQICDRNNIGYFLIAGTLLGAVRHKGFIPWDDDLDIGMLRSDYDRFIKCAAKELPEKYFLQTFASDPAMGLPFTKVRKIGTRCVENVSSSVGWNQGVFIDIFPFDNVPEGLMRRKLHAFEIYVWKRLLLCRVGFDLLSYDRSFVKVVLYKAVLYPASRLFSRNFLAERLEGCVRRHNETPTKLVVAAGGAYGYKKESISRSWVTEVSELEFEGHQFKCPQSYNDYLFHFYRDYMTLPPPEKRVGGHQIIELNIGHGSGKQS